MGGFFSKQTDTTKALLDADSQAADYHSTSQTNNRQEALHQKIAASLNSDANGVDTSLLNNCISNYLLDEINKEHEYLDHIAYNKVKFLINLVESLLKKYQQTNNAAIESLLSNTLMTILSLCKAAQNSKSIFKVLNKNGFESTLIDELDSCTNYKSDKQIYKAIRNNSAEKIQAEIKTPNYLKQKNNPILNALKKVLGTKGKRTNATSRNQKKIMNTETTPFNPANNASLAGGTKKTCYLCCY